MNSSQAERNRNDEHAALLRRATGEFLEMPGLRLLPLQAARLWAIDAGTSQRILDRLVETGFLWRTRDGAYVRPSSAAYAD